MQIPNQILNSIFTNNNDIFEMFKHKIDALKNIFEDDDLTSQMRIIIINVFGVIMDSLYISQYD